MSKSIPKQRDLNKDLSYYLTLFTLEGHQTWRAHLTGRKDGFEIEMKNWKPDVKLKERQTIRIDRLTGGFSEVK